MFGRRGRAPAAAVVLSGQTGSGRAVKSINHIALAITRSLGRQGVPVFRFHPNGMLHDLESRYCKHVLCPNLYDEEAALVDCLLEFARSMGRAPVLFAASDGAASFISRHSGQLAGRYRLVVAPAACIEEIQDKGRLYRRAVEVGVAIPKTFEPASEAEAILASQSIDYPAVIKPLTSHHWKTAQVSPAVGGAKAVEVDSPQALLEVYRKVAPLAPRMMIQEIVQGEDERLLTFLGYFDREGRPLAGCVRKKLRQSPARFGYCCLTETVRDKEAMQQAVRLLSALGYRGIGCVEFKRDPRDGVLKLIEINTRAVRTTGMAIGAGVDLPFIAYCDMVGVPVKPCFHYRVGMRWVALMDEIFAARELMAGGELTFSQWLSAFRAPMVEAEWAWDDPLPFLDHTGRQVGRLLASATRRRVVPQLQRGLGWLGKEMPLQARRLSTSLRRLPGWVAARRAQGRKAAQPPVKEPAAAAK